MPNEELIAIALGSTLSIFALIALCRWPYRYYCVDRFRDEMFDARAHLFHLAAAGTLRFDDKAYSILRSILNSFIRFGGTLDMSSAFAIAYTDPRGNVNRTPGGSPSNGDPPWPSSTTRRGPKSFGSKSVCTGPSSFT